MSTDRRRAAEEARADIQYRLQTEGVRLAYEAAVDMLKDPGTPATAKGQAMKTILMLGGFDGKREAPLGDDPSEWSPQELQREIARMMRESKAREASENDSDVFG